MNNTTTTRLTDADRRTIAKARELIAVRANTVRDYTGDPTVTGGYVVAFGRAQWELGELLAIIARLDGHAAAQDTEDSHE